MQLKNSHSFKYYNILRLNKEDLIKISEIFSEQLQDIEIEADDYKLNDISEINNIQKDEIYYFKIRSSKPYIELELKKHEASIYIADDRDIVSCGVRSRIDEILKKRESKILGIINSVSTCHTIINLKGQNIGFFSRYKDQIYLLLIGGIFGAILSGLFVNIFRKYIFM